MRSRYCAFVMKGAELLGKTGIRPAMHGRTFRDDIIAGFCQYGGSGLTIFEHTGRSRKYGVC